MIYIVIGNEGDIMPEKDTKSKTPVVLKDADLDEVSGGLFSLAGSGTEVVSGPIPKGVGLVSSGAEKDGDTVRTFNLIDTWPHK